MRKCSWDECPQDVVLADSDYCTYHEKTVSGLVESSRGANTSDIRSVPRPGASFRELWRGLDARGL